MTRLGVFGGSFDPIHCGHLRLAEEARETFALDSVLFVPTQVSPFKTGRTVTPAAHRLEMVKRATADNAAFAVSAIECERGGTSYTADTLRVLRDEMPDAELVFLTGADALAGLPRWRDPDAVMALARFAVATRPGTSEDEIRSLIAHLPEPWRERIRFFAMTGLAISSTDLRARLKAGRSVRYLVPDAVGAYIAAHGLYKEE